jgi:hypothetical protein
VTGVRADGADGIVPDGGAAIRACAQRGWPGAVEDADRERRFRGACRDVRPWRPRGRGLTPQGIRIRSGGREPFFDQCGDLRVALVPRGAACGGPENGSVTPRSGPFPSRNSTTSRRPCPEAWMRACSSSCSAGSSGPLVPTRRALRGPLLVCRSARHDTQTYRSASRTSGRKPRPRTGLTARPDGSCLNSAPLLTLNGSAVLIAVRERLPPYRRCAQRIYVL